MLDKENIKIKDIKVNRVMVNHNFEANLNHNGIRSLQSSSPLFFPNVGKLEARQNIAVLIILIGKLLIKSSSFLLKCGVLKYFTITFLGVVMVNIIHIGAIVRNPIKIIINEVLLIKSKNS